MALREERRLSQDDLARLLTLNAGRGAAEKAAGLVPVIDEDDDIDDNPDEAT